MGLIVAYNKQPILVKVLINNYYRIIILNPSQYIPSHVKRAGLVLRAYNIVNLYYFKHFSTTI